MFIHRLDQSVTRGVEFHWYLLSLNGGLINAGGFLATGRFVSHVTGFATLFGVDVVNRDVKAAIGILSVPIFFLLGSFVAGMLIDRPIHRQKKPHFDYVMALSAICLFVAANEGALGSYGSFGGQLHLEEVYVLLSLLCLACGLQNGAITSSSGASVRTTHLTGLTTDLGLGFARLLTLRSRDSHFKKEVRASRLRLFSIVAFGIGSAAGAWLFMKFGYHGFVVPGVIASYAAWHGRKAKTAAHRAEGLG